MEAVLSVAGSDSSGGAGIQADIKTIMAQGLFAETAITALTAQNTTGVYGVVDVDPAFVEQQIDVVFSDIRPAAVKVGMVSSPAIAHAIARALARNQARNVVVDPVMVATSGAALMADETVNVLVNELFSLASVVTPNIPEAQVLCGFPIKSEHDMVRAARVIADTSAGTAVLVKGGHGIRASCDAGSMCGATSATSSPDAGVTPDANAASDTSATSGANDASGAPVSSGANDLLYLPSGEVVWLRGDRVNTTNSHGTGCTLSSAIACGLARGLSLEESVRVAKEYVTGALAAGLDLGKGSGPLDHAYFLKKYPIQS